MEEMQQSTKIILTWGLYEGGVPKGHIAQQLGINPLLNHLTELSEKSVLVGVITIRKIFLR
jgi:hypothetical protein